MSRLLNLNWTPRQALAAAFAFWACCLLAMSLFFGFGGRFGPLDSSDGTPPEMPKNIELAKGNALKDFSAYQEIGQRPLLMNDRRPAPVSLIASNEEEKTQFEATLSSVILAGNFQMAILTDSKSNQTYRVKVGESAEGSNLRLVALEPRRAIFEGPNGQQTFDLRVFDGKGSQEPTTISVGRSPVPNEPEPANAAGVVNRTPVMSNNVGKPPEAVSAANAQTQEATQQQQIEAIRQRIEARRAQMRAEAERNQSQKVQ
jgi:general secretion pathway protein N